MNTDKGTDEIKNDENERKKDEPQRAQRKAPEQRSGATAIWNGERTG
jgi:hypothetical protein